MTIKNVLDDNIMHLEMLLCEGDGSETTLEYNGNEKQIILAMGDKEEKWFSVDEFKVFIKELNDFVEVLERQIKE